MPANKDGRFSKGPQFLLVLNPSSAPRNSSRKIKLIYTNQNKDIFQLNRLTERKLLRLLSILRHEPNLKTLQLQQQHESTVEVFSTWSDFFSVKMERFWRTWRRRSNKKRREDHATRFDLMQACYYYASSNNLEMCGMIRNGPTTTIGRLGLMQLTNARKLLSQYNYRKVCQLKNSILREEDR